MAYEVPAAPPSEEPPAPPLTYRWDGGSAPVGPELWAATKDTDPVPGSITAGDAFTAGEAQQG